MTIRVTNHLPHRTSVHWHGLEVPNLMDGVPPLEPSPYIYPGEYFDYSFTICNPPGTYMYHSHVEVPIQDNAGLFGGLIVENPCRTFDAPDKDYLCILQEWAVNVLPWGDLTPGTYPLNFVKPMFNFLPSTEKAIPRHCLYR